MRVKFPVSAGFNSSVCVTVQFLPSSTRTRLASFRSPTSSTGPATAGDSRCKAAAICCARSGRSNGMAAEKNRSAPSSIASPSPSAAENDFLRQTPMPSAAIPKRKMPHVRTGRTGGSGHCESTSSAAASARTRMASATAKIRRTEKNSFNCSAPCSQAAIKTASNGAAGSR